MTAPFAGPVVDGPRVDDDVLDGHATPSAHTQVMQQHDIRIAHQLALGLAATCERLGAPDFGEMIDADLLTGDRLALFDLMFGAQNVAWWTAQRSCAANDLLGESMFEFRHLLGCLIDGYPAAERSVTEICDGLRQLGCRSVFVQLAGVCGAADALDLADTFDELPGFDDSDA